MDPLYGFVRLVARFWIWFFFKAVEVRHPERVPRQGPVLLCINHPNNLIDSLLVGCAVPRKVHYLATAALFRNPLMARFLGAAGVIPVYRRADDPDKMDKNVATFEACFRALEQGRLIGIYPEGTTHAEPRVQRIKTGAARIALEAESRRGSTPGLAIIPVGLTFEARKSFRSRVLVSFGEPMDCRPYLDHYRDDPWKAVDALTTAIQWGMEAQVIHVERIDADDLVREVEALYRGDLIRELQAERGLSSKQIDLFRLSRTIVDAVQHFKARDPDRVERIWQRIQAYSSLLAEYRIQDQAVHARLQASSLRRRLGSSGLGLLGLPVFAYGAAVNALPYFVPRWIARTLTTKETDYATARLLSSIVLFPLFWGVETWLVWRLSDLRLAALFLASLPLSGLLAYRYLGGLGRIQHQFRFGYLSLTRNHAARRLLIQRREILNELELAKRDYLAATRGSSF
ncbi:MAG: 1-acyl-sn-glycerol-3-phosphate acyltransferase [Candidatus Rokubacteria bacterium]|nr:1-acyl-sn-glycerol-3-phosphate acyltransferase [Candidatus Rokubacteria bacterium]